MLYRFLYYQPLLLYIPALHPFNATYPSKAHTSRHRLKRVAKPSPLIVPKRISNSGTPLIPKSFPAPQVVHD